MTDSTFNYDDCKPHRDGKRRAVDSNKDTHVLLCNDAPGDYPIKTYRERDGMTFGFRADACLYALRLVGPAPEEPREWCIVLHAGTPWTVADTLEEAQQKAAGPSVEYVRVVEKRS